MDFAEFLKWIAQCCENSTDLPVNEENYATDPVVGQILRPEKAAEYYHSMRILETLPNRVARNFIMREGPKKILHQFRMIDPFANPATIISNIRNDIANKFGKIPNIEIPKSETLDDLVADLEKMAENFDIDKTEILESIAGELAGTCTRDLHNKDEYVGFLDTVKGLSDDPDKLITEEIRNYQSYEKLGERVDNHPYAEQIEQLKAANPHDPDLCFALDEANKVLVEGDEGAVDYSSKVGEQTAIMATKCEYINSKRIVENDIDYDGVIECGDAFFTYVGPDTPEAHLKIAKKVIAEDLVMPKEQQEALKKIAAEMLEYKIFDPENYDLSSNGKRAITGFETYRAQLIQAIKDGDREKIFSSQKGIDDFFTNIDKIIAELKAVDDHTMRIQPNTAYGRNSDLPVKYRTDVVGMTRLSTMWLLLASCRETGMDVNEIIEHPVKGLTTLLDKMIVESNPLNDFARKSELSDLIYEATTSGEQFGQGAVGVGVHDNTATLVIEGISMMMTGPDKDKMNVLNHVIFAAQRGKTIDDAFKGKSVFMDPDLREEAIARLMLVESQDRDLFRLSPSLQFKIDYQKLEVEEPFDKEKYVKSGKTNFEAIRNRILNTVKDFSNDGKYGDMEMEDVVRGAAMIAGEALVSAAETECEMVIAQSIANGETEFKKTDLLNYHAERKLREAMGEKVTSEKYPSVIKELANLKKEYNDRSFFAKIFYSSVRRQSRLIEGMVNRIADDTNLTPEQIKENVRLLNSEHEKGDAKTMTENFAEAIADKEAAEMEASRRTQHPQQVSPEQQAEFKSGLSESLLNNEKAAEKRIGESNDTRVRSQTVQPEQEKTSGKGQ